MKRTKSIKIWLSEEEHDQLLRLKSGSQLATWVRETCMGKKSKRKTTPPKVDPVLLRHLAAVGNNLNQVARQANRNLEPLDALDVIVRLDAIMNIVTKIREDHAIKNP